jgi:hypothetical protein
MNRRLHLALAFLVALALACLGALLADTLWADDDGIAIGLGLLWSVVMGLSVVAYWEEVIDR